MKPQLFITILCLLASINVASADVGAVYDAHIAWKTAFEKADIAAVNKIWSHAGDTTLITVGGEKKDGWNKIQATFALSFQLIGETQVEESNLLITITGDTASATSNYQWSPLPNVPLKAVERYRKENGVWKMHAQDGTGVILPPLRPNDETRLRAQVQKILGAIALADIDKLLPLVADNDFTYVALDDTVHRGFPKAIVSDDLAKFQKVDLEVVYLTDEVATVHLTLTLVGNNERNAQLVMVNFQLTKIDFAPKSLAVISKGKLTTTWAKIKER